MYMEVRVRLGVRIARCYGVKIHLWGLTSWGTMPI